MFSQAYLEDPGGGRLRHEEELLRGVLVRLGIPVAFFTAKDIQRRRLPLKADVFVSGDVDAVHGALRQQALPVPEPNDYPDVLSSFLGRRVWLSSLRAVERRFFEGAGGPIFVKPAARTKNFTGRVLDSWNDLQGLGGVSRSQRVWCSEVVGWRAEYRVYVCRREIISVDHYRGDSASLDMELIDRAVRVFSESGTAPVGYAVDFGVLDSGATALVEVNDGYSLGAYAISPEPYANLVFARWRELLSQAS